MKAVFSVVGDGPFPQPGFDITVCFNGVPGDVVLEVNRIDDEGYSGSGENPVTTHTRNYRNVMRTALKSSHARAIASALLSAATESKE